MRSYALLALAAAGYASAQGVAAGTLLPTTATPAGCSQNYTSKFEITIVQSASMKRDLVQKRETTCSTGGVLVASLTNGILTDASGRIGGIVANRQFQFDGPPSQTGTIYNGGWSVCSNGSLALGGSNIFYQCLSGGFYNLYDEAVAAQCEQVLIDVIPCTVASTASTTASAASVVAQSSDGQVTGASATTTKAAATTTKAAATTVVSQIADGQLQASSAAALIPVSQYTDGQIQVTASPVRLASTTAVALVSQISDGQIQATAAAKTTATQALVSQISDGQLQATSVGTVTKAASTTTAVGTVTKAASTTTSARATYTGAANMASFGSEMMIGAAVAAALLI